MSQTRHDNFLMVIFEKKKERKRDAEEMLEPGISRLDLRIRLVSPFRQFLSLSLSLTEAMVFRQDLLSFKLSLVSTGSVQVVDR